MSVFHFAQHLRAGHICDPMFWFLSIAHREELAKVRTQVVVIVVLSVITELLQEQWQFKWWYCSRIAINNQL